MNAILLIPLALFITALTVTCSLVNETAAFIQAAQTLHTDDHTLFIDPACYPGRLLRQGGGEGLARESLSMAHLDLPSQRNYANDPRDQEGDQPARVSRAIQWITC